MRTLRLFAAAVLLSSVSCGRVSMDVATSDPRTNRDLSRAQTAGKTVYNGWSIYDAWKDALDKIGPHDELAVGQMAALQIVTSVGDLVLEDEQLLRYVNSVGNLVALQGERQVESPRMKGRRFFFGVVRSPEVNAFSTPGGNVLVTTGLLERLNDEAELAFVLGHEIAHVDHEHGLLALKGAIQGNEALKSVVQLTLRKDKKKEPVTNLFEDLKIFEKTSAAFADLVVSKANVFSAAQERAADATGLSYAVKAGYDPVAAQRVFEMLQAVAGGPQKTMSHGAPDKRRKELEKEIAKHPTGKTGYSRWQERGIARLEAAQAAAAGATVAAPAPSN